jgi:hypothetical protein
MVDTCPFSNFIIINYIYLCLYLIDRKVQSGLHLNERFHHIKTELSATHSQLHNVEWLIGVQFHLTRSTVAQEPLKHLTQHSILNVIYIRLEFKEKKGNKINKDICTVLSK